MFGRPTRSYAHVEHDADGMSSVAAAPYSLRKEGTFKTYRAPLSEHSRRLDPGHIPHALQSRHARKQAAQEGARAELDQILESGYRPSSRSVHNGAADDQYSYREGPESAGMSRHRTAGGLQAESSRMARLRSTASIGSFRGVNGSSSGQTRENGEGGGGGGGGSKKGVFVDADGRTHDQEYDPFARHAAESRKKSMSSRRRSAFGSTSAHGHSTAGHGNGHGNGNGLGQDGDTGSETNSSDSGNSDGGMSGRYSAGAPISQGLGGPVPPRKSIDASSIRANGAADREEEEIRRRLAVERRRLEGLSGYNALAKRRSIISERDRAGGHGTGSIRTMTDEAERMTLHSNYTTGTQYGAAGGAAGRRSQGEYNPSPLSPTFSAASAHGGRARTNTTSDGGDETPVKSTENTLMPPMSPPQPPSPDLSAYGSAKGSMVDHRGPAPADAEVHVPPPSASHRGSDAHMPRDPHSAKASQARAQIQPPKAKVEIKRDGSRKVTGFDAPRSPMPPPPVPTATPPGQQQLDVPPSAKSAVSRGSRGSSDINMRDGDESVYSAGTNMGNGNGLSSAASTSARYRREREKPAPRPREEIFPETPAQAKRREEKERRAALRSGPSSASAVGGGTGSRAGSVTGGGRVASSTIIRSSPHTQAPTAAQSYASTNIHSRHHNGNATASQLAIDTSLAASTRLLPEIQIVEDDDPRIVFPSQGGRSTRVQTVHDHVIRGPFSHALNAQGLGAAAAASGVGYGYGAGGAGERSGMSSPRAGSRAGSPGPSAPFNVNAGGNGNANKPSSINSPFSVGSGTGTVEDRIGYLPSRWASGDKQLRMTEGEREMYRPKEWGGRKGELGGRPDDWHPELKDQIKRSWKDVQTNARFSLFRAKKKLGRM